MGFVELFLIAVGLSMDAFAVSVCKGLSVKKLRPEHAALVGIYFGGFQFLMPLIGYLLGSTVSSFVSDYAPYISFFLLAFVGIKMLVEAIRGGDKAVCHTQLKHSQLLVMAIATSLDALAVGVTFAFLQVKIVPAISFIGATTFILSAIGIRIGNIFGAKYKSKAELVGGIVLILMGAKILLEHLGVPDMIFG